MIYGICFRRKCERLENYSNWTRKNMVESGFRMKNRKDWKWQSEII
jgi:hypothetical protein